MNPEDYRTLTNDLLVEAYEHQMEGDYDLAIEFYQRSIEAFPTAEAYTFLGWTYSYQGKLDEAIEECKKAIQVDPDFGNPYNDIGAYLIEKSQHDAAIPWLTKASKARCYESPHYAHYNLGPAYVGKELYNRAKEKFETALKIRANYRLAQEALQNVRTKVN